MAIVSHETCVEHCRRLLREGFELLSLEGYNAILLSPEGDVRRFDLRNDTETRRPNAPPGDECNIQNEIGAACPNHYLNVDEAVPDGDSTRVNQGNPVYKRDLYNMQDSAIGAGTINSVTVYAHARCYPSGPAVDRGSLRNCCKTGGVAYQGSLKTVTKSWVSYSHVWANNPGGGAWTWAQIDALQIGLTIAMCTEAGSDTHCTQVYAVIDYTPAPPGWSGKVAGVTDPAAVMEVAKANIQSVKGVASA